MQIKVQIANQLKLDSFEDAIHYTMLNKNIEEKIMLISQQKDINIEQNYKTE